jgi:TPR repeat protein
MMTTGILRTLIGMRRFVAALRLVVVTLFASSAVFAITPDIPRIEAGAGKGSIEQEIELGSAYFTGTGVEKDAGQAAYWYEKAANSGDPNAQVQIGYFYEVGIGVTRDPERAVHWYQRAAAGGLSSANVNLGVAYLWGVGIRQDQALAAELFRRSVSKGCGVGATYLGDMYYFGIGVRRNVNAAQHWYTVGAKLHDPQAEFRLAGMLMGPSGERKTLRKEVGLLRRSMSAGYIPAKHALGLLLANHPELASTPREPIQLLEEAAEAGTWKSSAVLGILARDGRGIPADPRLAYFYFRVAELQGGNDAINLVANDLSVQSGKLTRTEMEAANAEAAEWLRKHPVSLQFVYKDGAGSKHFPAYALTTADNKVHAGQLIPTPPAQRE